MLKLAKQLGLDALAHGLVVDESSSTHVFRAATGCLTILVEDFEFGRVVRKIASGHRARKLRAQFDWLVEHIDDPHVPRALRAQGNEHLFAYDMHYVEGRAFREFIQSSSISESKARIDQILTWVHETLHRRSVPKIAPSSAKMYLEEKLFDKVNAAVICSPVLQELHQRKAIFLNGQVLPSSSVLFEVLRQDTKLRDELGQISQVQLHGDLTVENCIVTQKNSFVVFDPNDENYVDDPIVDYAKLLQSLEGHYEFLDEVSDPVVDSEQILFTMPQNLAYARLAQVVRQFIQENVATSQMHLLDLHVAIHFARLLPYKALENVHLLPVYYAIMLEKLFELAQRRYDLSALTK